MWTWANTADSMMSSILSTAVENNCAPTHTLATPVPAVTQAIEVFDLYCARSTELVWCMYHCNGSLYPAYTDNDYPPDQNNSTVTSTPSITPPPSSLPSSSTAPASSSASPPPPASSSKNTVPVAAHAPPLVIGVLALAAVVGLLFWMRRRRAAKSNAYGASHPEQSFPTESQHHARTEMPGYSAVPEMPGNSVKYQHEMEVRPAELEDNRKG